MRFTSPSLALALISLATLSAGTATHGDLAHRNYKPETSGRTVCGCITGAIKVNGRNCGNLATELCTCTNVLAELVESTTRNPIRTGRDHEGRDRTISALTDRINKCKKEDKRTCTHPKHSHPSCSRRNLCGYTCDRGYHDCGNNSCKRVCSAAPTGYISHPDKRDENYWGHRAQRSCAAGWTACGVPGGTSREWECLNTQTDLESCGGCPSGTVSSLTASASGKDCTAIPHIADVACVAGGCAVQRCLPGFKISSAGDACVAESSLFRTAFQAASAWGLEHIPLDK
ncbi:hypothetical protein B0H15DRAFT_408269 [Mycena belliarum]|uniref:Protein CPL1-like domain-containing protein n=1 Tax=Mycena belliarum TaxID=1033014 RepID=A0AAD6UF21_9AGAR|nr:hypothetical protein B0H15DRAFT_408269 [Mycena belliae]